MAFLSTAERQQQFDAFLLDNPGDEGRASDALEFDTTDLSVSPFIPPSTFEQFDLETTGDDESDPDAGVVQEGDTGGFLEGTGITVGAGSSTTPAEADQFVDEALELGMTQAEIDDFLRRNPNDFNRLSEAFLSGGPRDRGGFNTLLDDPGFTGFGSGGDREANTEIDLSGLMALLANINSEGDQDVNLPGPGELPVIEVPGVNLSSDIDNALLSVLRGEDASTQETDNAIRLLLDSIGQGGNEDRLLQRQLQATETSQLAQQGLFSQLQDQLASRGLNSLPGVPQGAETAGARRVAERVAIPFAQELRQAGIEESELADARELDALQLATGWSADKATRVLQAAAAGTDRQRILSEIALGTLDRNIIWNQFLAQFGLDRERLLNDIRNSRFDRVGNILNQFMSLLAQLRGGFIGN